MAATERNHKQLTVSASTAISAGAQAPSGTRIAMDGFAGGSIILPSSVTGVSALNWWACKHDGSTVDTGLTAITPAANKVVQIPPELFGIRFLALKSTGANLDGIEVHLAS